MKKSSLILTILITSSIHSVIQTSYGWGNPDHYTFPGKAGDQRTYNVTEAINYKLYDNSTHFRVYEGHVPLMTEKIHKGYAFQIKIREITDNVIDNDIYTYSSETGDFQRWRSRDVWKYNGIAFMYDFLIPTNESYINEYLSYKSEEPENCSKYTLYAFNDTILQINILWYDVNLTMNATFDFQTGWLLQSQFSYWNSTLDLIQAIKVEYVNNTYLTKTGSDFLFWLIFIVLFSFIGILLVKRRIKKF